MVDVGDDRDVAQVAAGGSRHEGQSLSVRAVPTRIGDYPSVVWGCAAACTRSGALPRVVAATLVAGALTVLPTLPTAPAGAVSGGARSRSAREDGTSYVGFAGGRLLRLNGDGDPDGCSRSTSTARSTARRRRGRRRLGRLRRQCLELAPDGTLLALRPRLHRGCPDNRARPLRGTAASRSPTTGSTSRAAAGRPEVYDLTGDLKMSIDLRGRLPPVVRRSHRRSRCAGAALRDDAGRADRGGLQPAVAACGRTR